MLEIRDATREDLPAITHIYNNAILNTAATFDTEPKSMAEQETWFEEHGEEYPILVGLDQGHVVAWGSLSAWSDRCAYSDTAEMSLYVTEAYRGKGIGQQMAAAMLKKGREVGIHTVVCRMSETSQASIHILEKYGFRHIGVMKEVGQKFGKRLDVHLMQIIFSPSKTAS